MWVLGVGMVPPGCLGESCLEVCTRERGDPLPSLFRKRDEHERRFREKRE